MDLIEEIKNLLDRVSKGEMQRNKSLRKKTVDLVLAIFGEDESSEEEVDELYEEEFSIAGQ